MTRNSFTRSEYEGCVYFKISSKVHHLYLFLYVDDMLLSGKDMNEIIELKEQLKKEFEMKDLGIAQKILGMQIIRNRGEKMMYISQGDYLRKVLTRFGMANAKEVQTPVAARF